MKDNEASVIKTETGLIFLSMLAGNYVNIEIVKARDEGVSRISTSLTPAQTLEFAQHVATAAMEAMGPAAFMEAMMSKMLTSFGDVPPPDPDAGLTNP